MKGVALKRFSLRPSHYAAFLQIDNLARTGDFDGDRLRQIQSIAGVVENKTLSYYLASLYLQLGEENQAQELLQHFNRASGEMKRYYSVLCFSRSKQLPLPKLSVDEIRCMDYLERVLNPADHSVDYLIAERGGFSIIGNAPGVSSHQNSGGCKFYFNNYQKNKRISGAATVHVVTPSWNIDSSGQSDYLCITGNNIFYRRSRVWKKFVKCQSYQAVYTLPRQLWSELTAELNSSPSAGLLVLAYISRSVAASPIAEFTGGYVGGFSNGRPMVNHDYDSDPASDRHHWEAEALVYKQLIAQISAHCPKFASES